MARSSVGLHAALRLLLEAHEQQNDHENGRGKPAVSVQTLRQAGVSEADLRRLLTNGYAEYQRPSKRQSRGQTRPTSALAGRGRMTLTEPGALLSRQFLYPLSKRQGAAEVKRRPGGLGKSNLSLRFPDLSLPAVRYWHPDNRELWWGDHLVKRLMRPAPVLEAILSTFQISHWSERIFDILTPTGIRINKYQLKDVVSTWNDSPGADYFRLHRDGSGLGVRWERMR